MKYFVTILAVVSLLVIASGTSMAQWQCLYATIDDTPNGTGYQTMSVGVIAENTFVALVMTPNVRNYMLPYAKADSTHGRINNVGYGGAATSGVYQTWSDGGFDQVNLLNAYKIVARPDSTIYVANNDPEHNILVFKFTGDTIKAVAPFRRQPTGSKAIYGIAVDNNGYVYVSNDTSIGVTDDIKIYKPASQWNDSHTDLPLKTINLPDGAYKGITVSPNGSALFVSDATNRRILKFSGSPTTGYTQVQSFSFQLGAADTTAASTLLPIPIHLGYLSPNNILFAAVDVLGYTSAAYTYDYGRIYLLNPNTGARVSSDSALSIIDVAKWNLLQTGGYQTRTNGTTPGNASGYTSTFDVAFDSKGFLYSQSYFGWTVEKWKYNGTLPTIATSVERTNGGVPESFGLMQNYPNPFNPSTVVEFSIVQPGHVSLKVFDLLGREVALLVDEFKSPGTYRVTFNAENLSGGTYFYTLRAGSSEITKKMAFVK
jgi:hypothetical protein